MNPDGGIPIRVVGGRTDVDRGVLGGGLSAVLHEILAMLENLIAYGERGQIDIRSLPMAPGEHESLKTALGEGEVEVSLDVDGPTHCRETAYPGVWWVEHRNPSGATTAEFIEVATMPEILIPQEEDLRQGIERLERDLGRGHSEEELRDD